MHDDRTSSIKTLYARFEGGAVYTAQERGEFLVVIDESTMVDFLAADELAGMDLVKIIGFASPAERAEYLTRRFGPARR